MLRAQPRLESWQKIRTEEMLRTHLEGNIRITTLQSPVSSPQVTSLVAFARALHFSPPMAHQARIDMAKGLLRELILSLARWISVGIFDQGCLHTRVYQARSITPFRWRKLNGDGAVATDHLVSGELRPR